MKSTLLPVAFACIASMLVSCAAPRSSTASRPPLLSAAKSKTVSKAVLNDAAAKADHLDDYGTGVQVSDPLEKLNRATFWLNDGLYTVLLRPLSKGYEKVMPKFLRTGINNVFDNIKYPVRVVNCMLQGKFDRAGHETKKFALNTFAGVGGLVRISDKIVDTSDIPEEDSGQTLGVWGIPHGPYIVLPILGPSSAREIAGLAGDYALHPANMGLYFHSKNGNHDWMYLPPSINTARNMPSQIEAYDALRKDAVDPYLAIRDAYIQQRNEAVRK